MENLHWVSWMRLENTRVSAGAKHEANTEGMNRGVGGKGGGDEEGGKGGHVAY